MQLEKCSSDAEIDEGQPLLIIGHSQFKKESFDKMMPRLSQFAINKIICKRWIFDLNEQWILIIKSLNKTQCVNFKPWWDLPQQLSSYSIINSISHISFGSLITLDIANLLITNIESVAYLEMDQLRNLLFSNNPNTIFKPLDKTKWPQLENIRFNENYAPVLPQFGRVGLNSLVQLEFDNANYLKEMKLNLSQFVKIQTRKMERLGRYLIDIFFSNNKINLVLHQRFDVSQLETSFQLSDPSD